MKPLSAHKIALLQGMTPERPIVRFMLSLGASLTDEISDASFLIDGVGLDVLGPIDRAPHAIHVSVS